MHRKSIPVETRSEFERECSGLRARLKQLEATYEKKVDDLPGPFLSHVDVELYRDLLMLAREGLTIVKAYRAYFPALSLYDDGMFWFGLFQFINAAGGRFWNDGDQVKIPEDITRELALVLVEISWFSTATGGDIVQRNLEALGSTLLVEGVRRVGGVGFLDFEDAQATRSTLAMAGEDVDVARVPSAGGPHTTTRRDRHRELERHTRLRREEYRRVVAKEAVSVTAA